MHSGLGPCSRVTLVVVVAAVADDETLELHHEFSFGTRWLVEIGLCRFDFDIDPSRFDLYHWGVVVVVVVVPYSDDRYAWDRSLSQGHALE